MSWNPIRQAQDRAVFQGRFLTPGLCEITGGASRARRWEEYVAPGMDGGILVFMGGKLAHFTMSFHLFTEKHWDEWNVFAPFAMVVPQLGAANVQGFEVDHPVLREVDITQCVIESIDAPVQVDHGEWVINLQCIETRVFQRIVGRLDAVAATPDNTEPQNQDEADILALEAQNKAIRDALANDAGPQ